MQSSYKCRAECGARVANLTDLKAKNIKPEDKNIPDGTVIGLRLVPVKVKGHGKWSLLFTSPETHKRRDMGLGAYPSVSITEVRKAASAARELIRNGTDLKPVTPLRHHARSMLKPLPSSKQHIMHIKA